MENLAEEASQCSKQGNQYAFCSPTSIDNWQNGTIHNFIWNFNYPYYVSDEYLSLYLYYYIKFEYVFVKSFTDMSTATGGLTVTVDDSWFLSSPNSNNQTFRLYGYYLPSTLNSTQELTDSYSMYPKPFNFTITQLASVTNDSTISINNSTNHTTTTTTSQATNSNSSDLPVWAIAVIIIAVIALFCGIGALVWTLTQSRKNPGPKPEHGKQVYQEDSIDSRTRLFPCSESVPSSDTTCVPQPPKLASSNHTMMFLTENLRLHHQEDERRRLGQVLLQKQLEQDGTLVKNAGRSTRAFVADVPKASHI